MQLIFMHTDTGDYDEGRLPFPSIFICTYLIYTNCVIINI